MRAKGEQRVFVTCNKIGGVDKEQKKDCGGRRTPDEMVGDEGVMKCRRSRKVEGEQKAFCGVEVYSGGSLANGRGQQGWFGAGETGFVSQIQRENKRC